MGPSGNGNDTGAGGNINININGDIVLGGLGGRSDSREDSSSPISDSDEYLSSEEDFLQDKAPIPRGSGMDV